MKKFSPVKITCTVPNLDATVRWELPNKSTIRPQCSNLEDDCFPETYGIYSFSSKVASGEFYLEIGRYNDTDGAQFKCNHGTTTSQIDVSFCGR